MGIYNKVVLGLFGFWLLSLIAVQSYKLGQRRERRELVAMAEDNYNEGYADGYRVAKHGKDVE